MEYLIVYISSDITAHDVELKKEDPQSWFIANKHLLDKLEIYYAYYNIMDLCEAFNNEEISDLGYLIPFEVNKLPKEYQASSLLEPGTEWIVDENGLHKRKI